MKDLISKIIELSKNNNLVKIEALIEKQLNQDPNNIELLLRLAVLEVDPPFADPAKSIALLEKVLTIDKNNAIAALLIAYVNYYCIAGIDEKLMSKLNSMHTDDSEINSMLKYVVSWFYMDRDPKMEEQFLQKSINIYKGHVYNHVHLAKLYFKIGRNIEARDLIKKALKNIKKIYSKENDFEYDASDIYEFLNERIKGIYLTIPILESIKELLENKN